MASCAKDELAPIQQQQSSLSLTEQRIQLFKKKLELTRQHADKSGDEELSLDEALWNLEALLNYENPNTEEFFEDVKMEQFVTEKFLTVQQGVLSMDEILMAYDWLVEQTLFDDGQRALMSDLSIYLDDEGRHKLKVKTSRTTPVAFNLFGIAVNGFYSNDYHVLGGHSGIGADLENYCDGTNEGQSNLVPGGQPGILAAASTLRRRIEIIEDYGELHYYTDLEEVILPYNSEIQYSPLFEGYYAGYVNFDQIFETCIDPATLNWRLDYLPELAQELSPPGKELIRIDMVTFWHEFVNLNFHIYQRPTFTYGNVHPYTPPVPVDDGD